MVAVIHMMTLQMLMIINVVKDYFKDDADKSCCCGNNNEDKDNDYPGDDDVNEDGMMVMIMIGHHYDGDDDVFGWSDLNSGEPGHDMFGRLSLTLLARHPFSICIVKHSSLSVMRKTKDHLYLQLSHLLPIIVMPDTIVVL